MLYICFIQPNLSHLRGLSWDRQQRKYQVHIGVNGRMLKLGRYAELHAAALAYNEACTVLGWDDQKNNMHDLLDTDSDCSTRDHRTSSSSPLSKSRPLPRFIRNLRAWDKLINMANKLQPGRVVHASSPLSSSPTSGSLSSHHGVAEGVTGLGTEAPRSSHFVGVAWHKHSRKWQTQLCWQSRQINLGYYLTESEAALAYDVASVLVRCTAPNGRVPPPDREGGQGKDHIYDPDRVHQLLESISSLSARESIRAMIHPLWLSSSSSSPLSSSSQQPQHAPLTISPTISDFLAPADTDSDCASDPLMSLATLAEMATLAADSYAHHHYTHFIPIMAPT